MTRAFVPHDYQQAAIDWLYARPRTALYNRKMPSYTPMARSKQDLRHEPPTPFATYRNTAFFV